MHSEAMGILCCFALQGHNVLLVIHLCLGGLFTTQGTGFEREGGGLKSSPFSAC